MADNKKTINIDDEVTMYSLALDSCTEEDKVVLKEHGYDEDDAFYLDDGRAYCMINDATLQDLPSYFGGQLDYEFQYCDDEERDRFLNSFIKDAGMYLIRVDSARWDGAAGYRLVTRKENILSRDYGVTQEITGSSHRRKVMRWTEASHDVPMGSGAVAIALTDNEAAKMRRAFDYRDFSVVDSFVSRFED